MPRMPSASVARVASWRGHALSGLCRTPKLLSLPRLELTFASQVEPGRPGMTGPLHPAAVALVIRHE